MKGECCTNEVRNILLMSVQMYGTVSVHSGEKKSK